MRRGQSYFRGGNVHSLGTSPFAPRNWDSPPVNGYEFIEQVSEDAPHEVTADGRCVWNPATPDAAEACAVDKSPRLVGRAGVHRQGRAFRASATSSRKMRHNGAGSAANPIMSIFPVGRDDGLPGRRNVLGAGCPKILRLAAECRTIRWHCRSSGVKMGTIGNFGLRNGHGLAFFDVLATDLHTTHRGNPFAAPQRTLQHRKGAGQPAENSSIHPGGRLKLSGESGERWCDRPLRREDRLDTSRPVPHARPGVALRTPLASVS